MFDAAPKHAIREHEARGNAPGGPHVGTALELGLHLVQKMLPSRRLVFITAARLAIGELVIQVAAVLPWVGARSWLEFGGRMFIVLAVMSLVAHPEAVFMDALVRNVERLTGWRIGG